MNNKAYIPAFTIIEAVVSMVITAIIISVIFVIFSVTSERLYDFKMQNESISDLNRMNYTLNKSIFESNTMYINNEELIMETYHENKIKYSIYSGYLIRNDNSIADTFKIAVLNFKIDTLYDKSKRNIYQCLKCEIEINKQVDVINFYKKIYTDQLLKSKL